MTVHRLAAVLTSLTLVLATTTLAVHAPRSVVASDLSVSAAARVDQYATEAQASLVSLSLFEPVVGSPVLELGVARASGSSEPLASAVIDPLTILGTAVLGDALSSSSDGDRVSNPESGDGCLVDVDIDGIDVGAVCTTTTAKAGTPGFPAEQDAKAMVGLASVDADGRFIADLLVGQLGELLQGILDGVGADVLSDAIDELTTACNELLGELTAGDEPVDVPGEVGALLDLTGVELDAAREILDLAADPSCSALLELSLRGLLVDVIDLGPLADALAQLKLIQITLGDMEAAVGGSTTDVNSNAKQTFVQVSGPSLDVLDDIIVALIQGAIDGIVATLEETAGIDLVGGLDIPAQLEAALDLIPLLDDSSPLLTVVASGGSALASVKLSDATSSGGGDLPYVLVTIAPSILELFGVDPSQGSLMLTAGQTQTIAAGTPLESTVSVGDLLVLDGVEFGDTGMFGSAATASATTLSLLSGLEGGIGLSLGASTAGAYSDSVTPPDTPESPNPGPDPEMPNTGGGAALVALLAVGAAFALRRRRD